MFMSHMENLNIGVGMAVISNSKKIFHDLSYKEQNEIRRKYKNECYKDYSYSIKLYVLYVILGIGALSGLFVLLIDLFLGLLIFILCFIMMIINIYFLKLSNDKFFRYLKKHNYLYDRKRGI